ncbi:MAG: hypothetical protein M3R01_04395, partial [Actinomycetota bacterium]|nr:hypothetical protein [Actinomycetota bacterium]
MVGRCAGAGALVLLTTTAALAPDDALARSQAQSTDGSSELRVASVDASARRDVSVEVAVPRVLSGTELPAGAFTVSQGGQPLPAQVTHLQPQDVELALVLDTSEEVSPEDLTAVKGAAIELLLALPPGVVVSVFRNTGPNFLVRPPSGDRVAANTAVGTAARGGAAATGDALLAALDQLSTREGVRRTVLFAGGADAGLSQASADELSQRYRSTGTELHLIRDGAEGPASGVAEASGGTVSVPSDRGELVGAFQGIVDELAGRYQLDFRSDGQRPVDVTVEDPDLGIEAGTQILLPGTATTAEDAGDGNGGSGVGSAVVVLVGVALLGIAAAAFLSVRRLQKPHQDEREGPEAEAAVEPAPELPAEEQEEQGERVEVGASGSAMGARTDSTDSEASGHTEREMAMSTDQEQRDREDGGAAVIEAARQEAEAIVADAVREVAASAERRAEEEARVRDALEQERTAVIEAARQEAEAIVA